MWSFMGLDAQGYLYLKNTHINDHALFDLRIRANLCGPLEGCEEKPKPLGSNICRATKGHRTRILHSGGKGEGSKTRGILETMACNWGPYP